MNKLKDRLTQVWQTPNFDAFFEKFSKSKVIKIKKGDTLFYEGEDTGKVFYLKNGFIKLYQSAEDGHAPVVYLYGPHSLLGLRSLTAKEENHWHTCEALTECEVVTMDMDEYREILSQNPEYIVDLLYLFIQRLNYTERRLFGFVTAETTSRVAAFLYDCALRFGESKNGGFCIPVPLTHQNISEFIGAARESVTVAISKLAKNGVITDIRGQVTINDLEKLKTLARIV